MSKRYRSVNWDDGEKQLFRIILKDFVQIIENKSVTTDINVLKAKTWDKIRKRFNSLNRRERDVKQLKAQWRIMKRLIKNEHANIKREVNISDEGPSPETPNDSLAQIKDMLNSDKLLINHNIYDSDETVYNANSRDKMDSGNGSMAVTPRALQDANVISNDQMDADTDANFINNQNFKQMGEAVDKDFVHIQEFNEQADFILNITQHSKKLKEKEFERRMEMAEEKHALEMLILKENLKTAQLEWQITEKKLEKICKT